MANFFLVYVALKQGVTRDQVEVKMNKALDWFRYSSTNYVVYSTASVNVCKGGSSKWCSLTGPCS